MLRSIIANKV